MNTAINQAKQYSEAALGRIRDSIDGMKLDNKIAVTCGSYARREASEGSDIDFFFIEPESLTRPEESSEEDKGSWAEPVSEAISKIVPKSPAPDGAFSEIEFEDSLLHNIGGNKESNEHLTRRILFLLEGEWLFNEDGLKNIRRKILERYIGETMTEHQLALFLLNDIIRFYRTMAVDYEFKTVEAENPKPWGIRNIKLVFSRKLLYASGLFSVALTADRDRDQKIAKLEELFNMPVIDRMIDICGRDNMNGVLESYNFFLDHLENPDIREKLKKLQVGDHRDPLFRKLKNEGHHFTREILKLFERTYDQTHPIRRAVVF